MNGLDKIMRLEDFHEKDNQYSCLFTGYLSSRNSFVERLRSLKKSGKLTNKILIIERIIYCYSFEIDSKCRDCIKAVNEISYF